MVALADTVRGLDVSAYEAENRYSEFTYGSFVRTVVLPVGAQEEGITANYAKGVLTVTVPLGEQKEAVRWIEVASGE